MQLKSRLLEYPWLFFLASWDVTMYVSVYPQHIFSRWNSAFGVLLGWLLNIGVCIQVFPLYFFSRFVPPRFFSIHAACFSLIGLPLPYPTPTKCAELNKMKPTNPNAHTYVNGTDVKTHGYAVTHKPFCDSLFEQSCTCFPCYQSAVSSGKCRVWSVKKGVWSVKCGVGSVECVKWL